jgi:hypothetical protein
MALTMIFRIVSSPCVAYSFAGKARIVSALITVRRCAAEGQMS